MVLRREQPLLSTMPEVLQQMLNYVINDTRRAAFVQARESRG